MGKEFTMHRQLRNLCLAQEHVYAKALANFMFREIIEDAHVEYNISQEDIKEMCKNAVDRASLFLNHVANDPKMLKAFAIFAYDGINWDNPCETKYTQDLLELLQELTEDI